MRSPRGELGLAVLLCLAGATLVLLAATRQWAELGVPGRAPLPDTVVEVAGTDLVPGLRALGLVGLAGVVALFATRRAGRVVVGALLLLSGLAVVVVVVRVLGDVARAAVDSEPARRAGAVAANAVTQTAWPWVALAGGVLLLVAGGLVATRGPAWAALGRRYDAPATQAASPETSAAPDAPDAEIATERSLWEALDRGEDPTKG